MACGRGTTRVALAVLAVLLLGACRADLSVEVAQGAGGSGHVRATVNLDAEAAAQVPDLASQLRVDDLERAGWAVEGPYRRPGGGLGLRVEKPFASADGAQRAIQELSGSGGPFSSLRLTTKRRFWKTTTALQGTVDLRAGLAAFGDPELAKVLGSPDLGLDPAALERQLGKPLSQVVGVELVGNLPGTVTSNAPRARGGSAVWPVPLGSSTTVAASSQAWNVRSLVLAGVAVLCCLALLAVLVRRRRRI
ncbi:MAG TPA: hypothetical protein VFJ85_07030 [Acidimicrobiales bacterium]|nr:hypothetical protein [Acidimicrobiales bacterium]